VRLTFLQRVSFLPAGGVEGCWRIGQDLADIAAEQHHYPAAGQDHLDGLCPELLT
jgi:hypothetical protein